MVLLVSAQLTSNYLRDVMDIILIDLIEASNILKL